MNTVPTGPAVLVLDGQTTQALACVRSLGRAGYTVYVASPRRWPVAAASRHCRGHYRLAVETVGSFAQLRTWAAERGVRFVLPMTERACLLCTADAPSWTAAGMVLGCAGESDLLQVFDKARTLERARTVGLRVPPTYFPTSTAEAQAAAAEVGFPCVVKARFSYIRDGEQMLADPGVAYVARQEDLLPAVEARRQGPHWPLIQRYISGSASGEAAHGVGVSALCDHGRVVAWFAHERLRDIRPSGSGSSLRRSVPIDPQLRESARKLLAQLRWHGPAMFEFRADDDDAGGPWLIEINGRFWGSLQLAIASGADLPRLWVSILAGQPATPAATYWPGITLRWLWGDVRRLGHIMLGPPPGYPDRYPGVWRGLCEVFGAQPAGTRSETWDPADPAPAVVEWVQAVEELVARGLRERRSVNREKVTTP